jgi:hypothetical protein
LRAGLTRTYLENVNFSPLARNCGYLKQNQGNGVPCAQDEYSYLRDKAEAWTFRGRKRQRGKIRTAAAVL